MPREVSATEPCDLGAVEAAALVAAGELSPVELAESCLARVAATDPAVHALNATNAEGVLTAARATADRLAAGETVGPLAGLPVAVKDIVPTAGLTTTFGAAPYADHVPTRDDPSVARLKAAGAAVLAKTNTPELSIGANTVNRLHGATANPFDVSRTCGGSSGGSAVALACGMAPLATGSDHGGSLRIPATYCGVAAHRSTPGVVPSETRTMVHTNYSVAGPMGRSVADVALLLSVMARREFPTEGSLRLADPMAFPLDAAAFAQLEPVDLAQLRVGVSADLGGLLVSDVVRAAFAERVELLARWVRSVEEAPVDLTDAPSVDWQLRADVMATQYHRMAHRFDDGFNPNIKHTYATALETTVLDIAVARRRQMELFQHTDALFDQFDVLVCPGVSVPPFNWRQLYPSHVDGEPVDNYMAWLGLSAALTVVGHPVTALPAGTQPVQQPDGSTVNLPFGLQLVGRTFTDRRLLSVAAALEAAFSDHELTRRPTVDLSYLAGVGEHDALRTEGVQVAT